MAAVSPDISLRAGVPAGCSACAQTRDTTAGKGAALALLPVGGDLTHWHRAVPRAAPATQALEPSSSSSLCLQPKERANKPQGLGAPREAVPMTENRTLRMTAILTPNVFHPVLA